MSKLGQISNFLSPVSCDSLVLQGLRCEWGAGVLNLMLSLSLSHTGHWKFNMAPHGKEQSKDLKKIIVALHKDGVGHRSLTGGPRSGSGPKSRPARTRTYSQNIRLWSKTWRGASISAGAAFVFTVVVVETHRPIACELSHHVIPLSQSNLVNIATRQSADRWESSRLVTHEKTIER